MQGLNDVPNVNIANCFYLLLSRFGLFFLLHTNTFFDSDESLFDNLHVLLYGLDLDPLVFSILTIERFNVDRLHKPHKIKWFVLILAEMSQILLSEILHKVLVALLLIKVFFNAPYTGLCC